MTIGERLHDFARNEEERFRRVAEDLHRGGLGEEAIELRRIADRLKALREDGERAA